MKRIPKISANVRAPITIPKTPIPKRNNDTSKSMIYRPRKVKRNENRFVSRTFNAKGGVSIVTNNIVRHARETRIPIRMLR